MPDETRDELARKVAYDAYNRVDKHESQCALRYIEMEKAFRTMATELEKLTGRMWRLVIGGYALLLAIVAWLADRAF